MKPHIIYCEMPFTCYWKSRVYKVFKMMWTCALPTGGHVGLGTSPRGAYNDWLVYNEKGKA